MHLSSRLQNRRNTQGRRVTSKRVSVKAAPVVRVPRQGRGAAWEKRLVAEFGGHLA